MRAAWLWIAIAGASAAAGAQEQPSPATLDALVKCRTVAAGDARLACYDRAVGALAAAVERKEVVVVSQAEVREAKRSLFGIALPNIKLFGSGEADAAVEQISSTIRSVSGDGRSSYTLTLAEGGTWQTVSAVRFPPETDDTVTIRRAALGSYLANIAGGRAVRVQRLR